MGRALRLATMGVPVGGGGSILPLDLDFSTYADGALPSPLVGATWAVSSGAAVNNPTLGSEILTDPGLEANYTAGKCDTLTKSGTPALAQSADVHGGSKAQSFVATATGDRLNYPILNALPAGWYDVRTWGKRAAGSGGSPRLQLDQVGGGEDRSVLHLATSWTQRGMLLRCDTLNTLVFPVRDFSSSGWDTILVDDGSLKLATQSDLMALLPATQPDVVLKAKFGEHFYGGGGLILRANAQTNPTSFAVLWYIRYDATTIQFKLDKNVEGTWSTVLNWTSDPTFNADGWLELRASGSTVQVFYDETQQGGDLTISDSEIASNQYHGLFGSSGVTCTRFFCSANG